MYSTFVNQDIEVLDNESLKKFAEKMDCYYLIDDLGQVDFSQWDSMKIEGYWYDETRQILNAISPFIKGWAEFQYEEGYNFRIVFEDGKVLYQRQPEINWDNCPKEIIAEIRQDG